VARGAQIAPSRTLFTIDARLFMHAGRARYESMIRSRDGNAAQFKWHVRALAFPRARKKYAMGGGKNACARHAQLPRPGCGNNRRKRCGEPRFPKKVL
jgi:hypothetical protein